MAAFSAIAGLWVTYILAGERTFNQVPRLLKEEVAQKLIAEGHPEIVPPEFGGTMGI